MLVSINVLVTALNKKLRMFQLHPQNKTYLPLKSLVLDIYHPLSNLLAHHQSSGIS